MKYSPSFIERDDEYLSSNSNNTSSGLYMNELLSNSIWWSYVKESLMHKCIIQDMYVCFSSSIQLVFLFEFNLYKSHLKKWDKLRTAISSRGFYVFFYHFHSSSVSFYRFQIPYVHMYCKTVTYKMRKIDDEWRCIE